MDTLTLQNLRARLPSVGPSLLARYEILVVVKGKCTTPEDAFEAWCSWLEGKSTSDYFKLHDWPIGGFHHQVASVVREVAKYATPADVRTL